MDIHIMKPENQILIVDEKEFYRIKKKAEMTDSEIEAMVEKRFLEYVKDSGIKLSYEVNGIPYIFHYDLLSELNYEERGYPESVSEKVKHVIADDITEALNDKFKGLKDETYYLDEDLDELAKDYSIEFVKLQHKRGITECGILYPDVVLWSVELADALIKKLKGE